MANVLGKMGETIKSQEMMYKAVFQVVLLYGREKWAVTEEIMAVLEVFYHSIARQIVGLKVRKIDGGEWVWASVKVALETTGIWEIRGYVRGRKAKIIKYVAGRPIY